MVPGVRVDRGTLTADTVVSPWIQGEIPIRSGVVLRGGTGIYHQFPAFEQVVGSLAAPTGEAMRAEHYDLGVEHRIGETVRWQVRGYRRAEYDFFRRPGADARIVDGRYVAPSRTAPFAQTMEGVASGVEALLERKATSGLSGWFSYAYGHCRYTDAATGESYDGDLDQRHTLNVYGFFRHSDRVSFSLKARLGSNVPAPGYYREVDGQMLVSSTRNGVRLPVYARVDLRANRTFNWSGSRMTLFAEVLNVLNRDNVRFNPPGVNSRTLEVRNMYEQMIPILPSVGVLFEF
jgi:hypothetical protein